MNLRELVEVINASIQAAQISRNEKFLLSQAGEKADELSRKIKEYLEQGIE